MVAQLDRLFDHMFWADTLVLELLTASGPAASEEAVRLFSHLLAAERVWALRIEREDSSIQPIWPRWTLDDLSDAAADSRDRYGRILADARAGRLRDVVEYTNSRGEPFRTPLVDILTHVAMHGSYHRGQVANALRRNGDEPVNTDYITYVRETIEPRAQTANAGVRNSAGLQDKGS